MAVESRSSIARQAREGPVPREGPDAPATGVPWEDGGVTDRSPVPRGSAAPRRRHLIDPHNPPPRTPARETTQVQRWVMSALSVTTILHLSVGLMLSTLFISDAHRTAQIGLNVIAAAFGVIAVASGFLIHQRNALTPWLAVGLLPGLVGLVLVLR